MYVLVVDDDVAAVSIRRLLLEYHGHRVTVATNVDEASAAERPDVVVLDLRLPEPEQGLALIREFHDAGVRIVVLCGNPGDLDGRKEAALVAEILTKPVRAEQLISAIG